MVSLCVMYFEMQLKIPSNLFTRTCRHSYVISLDFKKLINKSQRIRKNILGTY